MKLFFDTCAVIDYLCNRQNADSIEKILIKAEKENWECFISVGSFYTLTYLIELLTSSSCHPKALVKEFSYFLMPCHQHGLGINLLVQR